MRFQTGPRNLFVSGVDGGRRGGGHIGGQFQNTGGGLEQMRGAEILQQIADARGGIVQFNAAFRRRALGIEFHAEAGQHAQKRAVHQHTVAQVNQEVAKALLAQFV